MENIPLSKNKEEPIYNYHKKNLLLRGVIVSVVLILLFPPFLFLSAPNNFPNEVIFNIEKGEVLKRISEDLKSKNIIRSKVLFEAFVIMYDGENKIAEGDYFFERKLPVFEIARRISKKDRHLMPIKITIPEGFDINQISEAYSVKLKNFNKEEFLIEAKNKEGYLFPDTYFFFTTNNHKDVLKYMSDNFNKKIKSFENEILSSGKDLNEIIVMASIIEREAKGDNDRSMISGILWSRISKQMPLQVDAAMDTYKTKGLPKTPICNPGIESIKAAINPTSSSYLYYIHDKKGMIHYANNFTQHRQNILKYLIK
jgi:UPF0755 protein